MLWNDYLEENPRPHDKKITDEVRRRLEDLDEGYGEIAEAMGLTPDAVRSIARRLRAEEAQADLELDEKFGEAERWAPMPGREGVYEISSFGRVMNVRTGEIVQHSEYTSTRRGVSLPRLVALAFIGDPPPGVLRVIHKDGDPENNFWRNLDWLPARTAKLEERREEILSRLASREKIVSVERDLGVKPEILRKFARKAGVAPRVVESSLTKEQKAEVIARAAAGEPHTEIADDYGISWSYVSYLARQAGVVKVPRLPKTAPSKIKAGIMAGEKVDDLAARLGISRSSVEKTMRELRRTGKLPQRTSGPGVRMLTEVDRREIRRRYTAGESMPSLAETFGVSISSISRACSVAP